MREEVGIDEDGVWRNERRVVLEEEGRGNLGNLANHCVGSLFLFVDVAIVLTHKSRISLADDTLDSAEFPSLFGSTHDGPVLSEEGRWLSVGVFAVCVEVRFDNLRGRSAERRALAHVPMPHWRYARSSRLHQPSGHRREDRSSWRGA